MIEYLPLVEKLFAGWRPWLAEDLDAYRNHVYRLINLVFAMEPALDDEDFLLLQIAAAFHGLGIWRGGSVDYLELSADEACGFLARHLELGNRSLEDKQRLVRVMVYQHHQLTALDCDSLLAEAFRRAHWTDLTGGWIRYDLSRSVYGEILRRFPAAGFHGRLARFMVRRLRKRPLSALAMLKL